jgi:AraC family transcriptional regulator
MNYEIVEKPGFRVVGKGRRITWVNNANKIEIPKFWGEVTSDGTFEKLQALSGGSVVPGWSLGICTEFEGAAEEFTYVIGVESDADAGEFSVYQIPATTFAVFKAVGPIGQAIQDVWAYAMGEFWETFPYTHGNAPDIQAYPPGDPHAENYVTEIWIPVRAK